MTKGLRCSIFAIYNSGSKSRYTVPLILAVLYTIFVYERGNQISLFARSSKPFFNKNLIAYLRSSPI